MSCQATNRRLWCGCHRKVTTYFEPQELSIHSRGRRPPVWPGRVGGPLLCLAPLRGVSSARSGEVPLLLLDCVWRAHWLRTCYLLGCRDPAFARNPHAAHPCSQVPLRGDGLERTAYTRARYCDTVLRATVAFTLRTLTQISISHAGETSCSHACWSRRVFSVT